MSTDVFKCIADPTRRDILLHLAAADATPNELAKQFNMSRQAVSKHIQVLVDGGLLRGSKSGREITYSFIQGSMNDLNAWVSELIKQWQSRF